MLLADLGEGYGESGDGEPPPPLFWVRKEEVTTKGKKSKTKPGSPLSSRSESATECNIAK